MSDFPWLDVTIFVPLGGAVLLGFVPRSQVAALRLGALMVTLVAFAASLGVLASFESGEPGFQLGSSLTWISEWGIGYTTGLDGVSLWMVMLTTFLAPLSVLSSWSITKQVKPFFVFLLALETGMLGVFSSLDMFLFYLFWEAVLVPMYFLIGLWGYDRRVYAAMKFFLYTLVGSLFLLLSILYLYFASPGQPTFDYRSLVGTELPLSAQVLLFLGFFASFAVKVPLVPLHTWLPDAHTEAPTAGSVMLAAVLLKMGAYGLVRFAIPFFPDAARLLAPGVITLAVIGIIYGGLIAIVQRDVKRLVAYSSVAHLGFVVLGLFVGTIQGLSGGILQMLNHGLSTGALFMLVGVLYDRRHTRQIADFGGLSKSMPVYAGIFLIVVLSSLGLPGLNGFVGEFLVLLGTYQAYGWWVIPATFGIVLSAIYLLWAYQRVFHGTITTEENRNLSDFNSREYAMILPVVVMIVVIGIYPKPFLDRIEPSAERIVRQLNDSSVLPEASGVAEAP